MERCWYEQARAVQHRWTARRGVGGRRPMTRLFRREVMDAQQRSRLGPVVLRQRGALGWCVG
ncbi:hemolysin D, partial [Xanthomonas oryzae pv. oryzae]